MASFHWLLRAPVGDTSGFNVSAPSLRVKHTFHRRYSLTDKTVSALPSLPTGLWDGGEFCSAVPLRASLLVL